MYAKEHVQMAFDLDNPLIMAMLRHRKRLRSKYPHFHVLNDDLVQDGSLVLPREVLQDVLRL